MKKAKSSRKLKAPGHKAMSKKALQKHHMAEHKYLKKHKAHPKMKHDMD